MTTDPETNPPGPADTRNLAAREVALNACLRVDAKGAALDGALASQPGHKRLEPRDRAFARAIAAAAIRRCGALDAALESFMNQPLPWKARRARLILRLGAAELLVLGNAPHAVVDAWVALMGAEETTRRYKGLTNAVLRRIAERGRAPFQDVDPLEDLPDWLAERWTGIYGPSIARSIAKARAGSPPLDLTVRPGVDPATVADAVGGAVLPTGTVRREHIGDVTELPGFQTGQWWAQDAAAALPARLLNVREDETVADLCAAPGGKTLQLAAAGAKTYALDRSANRLKRVSENLDRARLSAEIVAADAAQWRPEGLLDAVLLDAPCTATGTLRRRPDAAWSKRPADIASLARIQSALLAAACDMLKPGGRLIYCTCSLEPEEGEDQIDRLLKRRKDVALDPIRPEELPGLSEAVTGRGFVRTRPDLWPDLGGLDGFFIARLVKA